MRPRLIGEFAEDYMTMIADVYYLHCLFEMQKRMVVKHPNSKAVIPGFKTWSSICRLWDFAVPPFSHL